MSDQRPRGLANLKWSFLFFMVGGALTFVPFVGLVGGLFYIVALVFLIVGWRDLGRSTLIQFVSAVPALGSTPPSLQAIYQSQAFRNLESEFIAVGGAAYIAPLLAWYRVITSLMRLAEEVSQPRLKTAGWLLLTLAVFGLGSLAVFSAMLYTGVISFPTPTTAGRLGAFYGIYYYLSFAGYGGVVILVLSLVAEGLLILASYMGYKGLKGARLG